MVHTASVIPAAMPGVTAATAGAIQHADFAEALEAHDLLPGPTSREGLSALRRTYCRTPSPDDRAKRRTSALLKWIVSRASGVYSEHVRVVRIHPRYRGTPPDILTSRGFFYPLSIEWHLSVHSLPSSVPETSCIYAAVVYSNCTLELYGVIHALLLSYLLTILKMSS